MSPTPERASTSPLGPLQRNLSPAVGSVVKRWWSRKRSLMWWLARPSFVVSIGAACRRLTAQDVTVRPWNTSSKDPSPPAGRLLDQRRVHGLALPPRARPPIRYSAFVESKRRHHRLHGTPMGEQRHDEAHRLGRGAQAVKYRACGSAERLMALVADEPLFLLRMDTDIAPA